MLDAEIIESPGRAFPVDIRHAARDLAELRDLPEALARARAAPPWPSEQGDILAFLPGMAEIRRAEQALHGCGALVLPLHGDLPLAEQDRALTPADARRVVLATSIAETSLTVPGVRVVVDGGWRRTPKHDAATGLTRLATQRISVAAATQRAGRAGREAPGIAIRLWTPALQRSLPAFDQPEIFQAELAEMRLLCAAWGSEPGELPLPDAPPAGALAAATALLQTLGALDGAARITELGRRMARLGGHPRLAAMMLQAATPQQQAALPPISPPCWKSAIRCAPAARRIFHFAWPPCAATTRRPIVPRIARIRPAGRPVPPAAFSWRPTCRPAAIRRRCWPPPSPTASRSAAASPAASGSRAAVARVSPRAIRSGRRSCLPLRRWR